MAKLRGEVTYPAIELKTQGWYMAFQVIQVFLVMTFSSGAAAVVQDIINDPSTATTLLAESLPKASNFYISYFILQGLGIATGNLLNIGAWAMLTFVGKFLDKSPRKIFKRYITLAGLGWGTLYPTFGNLAIIGIPLPPVGQSEHIANNVVAITYSIIAPLVLGFATIGFALIYLATRYNIFYVVTNDVDTKGAAYAKVLQQLMTGIYISEVCLIGLFAINTTAGPIVLMAIFLGLTAIYHALMRNALKPLMHYLPESYDGDDQAHMFDTTDNKSYDVSKSEGIPPSVVQTTSSKKLIAKKASLFEKVWDPKKFKNHQTVQKMVPNLAPPQYLAEEEQDAYYNPAVTSPVPRLWVVRDEMGVSKQEIRDTSEILPITDDFAQFNKKNKVTWTQVEEEGGFNCQEVPVWEKTVDY